MVLWKKPDVNTGQVLLPLNPFASNLYRNQSIELHWKQVYWSLHDEKIVDEPKALLWNATWYTHLVYTQN